MCFTQCCLLWEVVTEHICFTGIQWGFNVVGVMTSLFSMGKVVYVYVLNIRPKCGNSILCFVDERWMIDRMSTVLLYKDYSYNECEVNIIQKLNSIR